MQLQSRHWGPWQCGVNHSFQVAAYSTWHAYAAYLLVSVSFVFEITLHDANCAMVF